MTPDTIEEIIIFLGILVAILLGLAAGCLISDFVLPHIRPIERYLESLPEQEDDEEIAHRYENIRRQKAVRLRKRIQAVTRIVFIS